MNNFENKQITFERFFSTGSPQPINRIAYSQADALYKIKCIRAMLQLDDSIEITIDKIGNICATLPGFNLQSGKSIVAGSHTDSVRNGGQFDGCLGVYFAMQTMERLAKLKKSKQFDLFSDYKVVIFACEESTRFGTACIGSSYLSKPDYVPNEDGEEYYYFDSLCNKKDLLDENDIEPNQGTLGKVLEKYYEYLNSYIQSFDLDRTRIKYVDRVVELDEINELYEGHIEQSQQLVKQQIRECAEYKDDPSATDFTMAPKPSINLSKLKTIVGMVTAIGKPVRGTIKVNASPTSNPIVTAAHLILNNRTLATTSPKDSIRTSIPEFNSFDENDEYETLTNDNNHTYYRIVCNGESNHSGGTPMSERRDANVGMSELITTLENAQKNNPQLDFNFRAIKTPVYGMNQIQDKSILYLSSSIPLTPENIANNPLLSNIVDSITKKHHVTFDFSIADSFAVPKSNHFVELKNDIRQNGIARAKTTLQKFEDSVINQTYKDIYSTPEQDPNLIEFTETSKGDPIQTSSELHKDFVEICKRANLKCIEMLSYPGHDCAVALSKNSIGKRFLLFIPSIYGSHNPDEQTWSEAVKDGSKIFSDLIVSRFKFLNRKAYHLMVSSKLTSDPVKQANYLNPSQELNNIEKEEVLDRLFE